MKKTSIPLQKANYRTSYMSITFPPLHGQPRRDKWFDELCLVAPEVEETEEEKILQIQIIANQFERSTHAKKTQTH